MINFRLPCHEDENNLCRLFERYPFKEYQQMKQKIDKSVLSRFLISNENISENNTQSVKYVGTKNGAVDSYSKISFDPWHSRFYEKCFGRVAPFLTWLLDSAERTALIAHILDGARQRGMEHLIVRIDGAEYPALSDLNRAGFYVVDNSVKMSGKILDTPRFPPPSGQWQVREFQDHHLSVIREIVQNSHPHNHYYNDPHLPKDQTDALFAAWVERCCTELPSRVFVLQEEKGDPVGFAIFLIPHGLNRSLGVRFIVLDFVCLHAAVQGKGLGRWFLSDCLQQLGKEYDLVELRTSSHNYPALNCYADLGLSIVSTDYVCHANLSQLK